MEPDIILYLLSLGIMVLMGLLLILTFLCPFTFFIYPVLKGYFESIDDMLSIQSLERIDNFSLNEEVNQWALEHNFSPSGTFYYKTRSVQMFVSTWIGNQKHTILSFLFCRNILKENEYEIVQQTGIDFSTLFEPDISLCTSNNVSGHTLPAIPTGYLETFSRSPIEILYRMHLKSVHYLQQKNALEFGTMSKSMDQFLLQSMHETCKYTKSLSFRSIKCIYWHFFRKYLWDNLTIQQQHEKGKIKLLNELEINLSSAGNE